MRSHPPLSTTPEATTPSNTPPLPPTQPLFVHPQHHPVPAMGHQWPSQGPYYIPDLLHPYYQQSTPQWTTISAPGPMPTPAPLPSPISAPPSAPIPTPPSPNPPTTPTIVRPSMYYAATHRRIAPRRKLNRVPYSRPTTSTDRTLS